MLRIAKVNKELTKLYLHGKLIGQVRLGMDRKWYPELPPHDQQRRAVRQVVLAHHALAEFKQAS